MDENPNVIDNITEETGTGFESPDIVDAGPAEPAAPEEAPEQAPAAEPAEPSFTYDNDNFLLDGEPFTIVAGAMHYFRVPKEYWRDRLLKIKACGFNTVVTAVPWNLCQKTENSFDFSDNNNVELFLDLAHELGLYAIVNAGPYIGADWDFGGLPWWLLRYDGLDIRCMNEQFIGFVDAYFDELIPRLAAHQYTRGGNVIMVQAENDYGSWGDDTAYMKYIADGLVARGIEVPVFTSDGIEDHMLTNGSVPGHLITAKFGANPAVNLPYLREFQTQGPLFVSEFWNGWFDTWGYPHYQRKPKDAQLSLQRTLVSGASVASYMAAGGTNFGLMNGAVYDAEYKPVTSSYDTDALITESGDFTKKYELYKRTISLHIRQSDEEIQLEEQVPKARYGAIPFTHCAGLFENIPNLANPVRLLKPVPMEKLGQGFGMILYRAHLKGPRDYMPLVIEDVHDRAYIFLNDDLYAVQSRNDPASIVDIRVPEEGVDLSILVDNLGRVSFGEEMVDYKGITRSVRLGQTFIYNWTAYPISFSDLSRLDFKPDTDMYFFDHPMFLKAQFIIDETPADTFIKIPDFKHGLIFINGRPLSRYWNLGPQRSAYLPAPWLVEGVNEIVLLELEGFNKPKNANPAVLFDDKPALG